MTSKNLVLVGFMGTGKTSVAKALSQKTGRPVLDIDRMIEEEEKRPIGDIFEKEGEARFRQLEKGMVRHASKEAGAIIAAGGGAVLDPGNVAALKENGLVIALTASPETVHERLKYSHRRPLLKTEDKLGAIRKLMEERRPFYETADLVIDTDGCTPEKVADLILEKVKL